MGRVVVRLTRWCLLVVWLFSLCAELKIATPTSRLTLAWGTLSVWHFDGTETERKEVAPILIGSLGWSVTFCPPDADWCYNLWEANLGFAMPDAGRAGTPLWTGPRPTWAVTYCDLPLWIPFLATFVPAAIRYLRRKNVRSGCCLNCGYDLTGNVSGRCPECGVAVEAKTGAGG